MLQMPINPKYPGISEPWNRTKADQQVNRPTGPKAHPRHRAALALENQRKHVRVRVEPVNEEQRHVLKHPNGMAFRDTGSVEWPLDRFTHRRIREGSIKVVEKIVGQERKPINSEPNNKPAAKPAAAVSHNRSRTEQYTPEEEK
jgi:hypothetical protein